MLSFFKKSAPILGLEVNESCLKVMEINQRNSQFYIERYASERIKPQSGNKSAVFDRVQALQNLIEKSQIQDRRVSIAVSGSHVFTRTLQMEGSLEETEIQEQIELGLEAWVPFSLEEIFYDFEVGGPSIDNPKTQEIRLAVAKQDFILTERKWIESTGLNVAVIDLANLALERAFRLFINPLLNFPLKPMECLVLLDIGDKNASLHIFQNGRFIFTRELGGSEYQVLQEMECHFRYPKEKSEVILKEPELIEALLEKVGKELMDQIHNALQLYFSEYAESSIGYIILSGAFSLIPNLKELIQSRLGREVYFANPLASLQFSSGLNPEPLSNEMSNWLLPMGLASWGF